MSCFARTLSFGLCSLTSSTIISHSTALFAYLFNVLAKTESFTLLKTAGVALALVGAAVVSEYILRMGDFLPLFSHNE